MPALGIRIRWTLQHDPEPVLSTSYNQNLFPVRFNSCTTCITIVLFDQLDKSSIMKIFVSKFLMGTTELFLVVRLKVVYRITKITNKVRCCKYKANSNSCNTRRIVIISVKRFGLNTQRCRSIYVVIVITKFFLFFPFILTA